MTGQGEQDLKLEGIPSGTEFPANDEPEYVFTVSYEIQGEQGRYPPGILIGQVSKVYEGANALEDDVSVSPAVDFSALEYVLVLRTPAAGTGS